MGEQEQASSPDYVAYLEESVGALREELERYKHSQIMLVNRIWDLEEQLGLRVGILRFKAPEPSMKE